MKKELIIFKLSRQLVLPDLLYIYVIVDILVRERKKLKCCNYSIAGASLEELNSNLKILYLCLG